MRAWLSRITHEDEEVRVASVTTGRLWRDTLQDAYRTVRGSRRGAIGGARQRGMVSSRARTDFHNNIRLRLDKLSEATQRKRDLATRLYEHLDHLIRDVTEEMRVQENEFILGTSNSGVGDITANNGGGVATTSRSPSAYDSPLPKERQRRGDSRSVSPRRKQLQRGMPQPASAGRRRTSAVTNEDTASDGDNEIDEEDHRRVLTLSPGSSISACDAASAFSAGLMARTARFPPAPLAGGRLSVRDGPKRRKCAGNSQSHRKVTTSATPAPASAFLPEGFDMVPVDEHEPRYCICNGFAYGDMIACDDDTVGSRLSQ